MSKPATNVTLESNVYVVRKLRQTDDERWKAMGR